MAARWQETREGLKMDFRFSDEDMAFGREVADFVDRELPWDWRTYHIEPEDSEDRLLMRRFQKKLAERGWLTLGWPKEYGGQGASHIRQCRPSAIMGHIRW